MSIISWIQNLVNCLRRQKIPNNPYAVSSNNDYRSNIRSEKPNSNLESCSNRAKAYPTSCALARVLRACANKQCTFLRFHIQMIALPTNESYFFLFLLNLNLNKSEKDVKRDSWRRMASAAAICCFEVSKITHRLVQKWRFYV